MFEPLLHQEIGAAFLTMPDAPRLGLLDDMGLGKSLTAILSADQIGAKRILIFCPAAVRQVWLGEFKKFAKIPRRIKMAKDLHDLNLWLLGKIDVLVASYEYANRHLKSFLKRPDFFEVLVLDEFHYLKSFSANRTKAVLGAKCDGGSGWALWAARTWCLTGTLMANDPTDAWSFLRFTGLVTDTDRDFKLKYFNGAPTAFGARYSAKNGVAEKVRGMIATKALRRTKSEVWKNMPAFWATDIRLDGDTAEIRALIAEHPGLEEQIKMVARAEGLSALDAPHIATWRRLVGEAKAVPFCDVLEQKMADGLDKAVVMGLHTRALSIVYDTMASRGFNPVMIRGDTSPKARKEAVERFQGDPECRVFVGNIKAAGTGLTLTAASDIFMLEQAWAPADNAQALMRVHRIGQTRNVTATFVALNNSVDEIVVEILAEKTANICAIDPTAFNPTA